ncbi:MAG: Na/Pi cotransporter family protein [Clostridia bacterium]|nr:Na/Pi cotransporter family protein [Clostridia bacterium]
MEKQMNPLFIVLFNFIVGVVLLMYGVGMLSDGLEKANVKIMKKVLGLFTKNVFSAFLVGTIATALVQSSTAITVLTVGFVNSGLITLAQAVGIIYGANIGTTITAQLMSFDLSYFAPFIFSAGLLMRLFFKRDSSKNIAKAIMGFGLMFIGIRILSSGVPYIRESEFVYRLFREYGTNPYIGVVLGMLTTMLVHSSSATVGITIVLFNSGLIGFEAAVGLTLGDNIGTCITAQLSSIGTTLGARRTAWAHTLYNVIGTMSVLAIFYPFSNLVYHITHFLGQDNTRLVANTHTLFNLLSAATFLPITKYYIRFIQWIIPDKSQNT